MNPEDVPAELVKKAARAVAEFNACGYCDGSCEGCTGEARAALSAVMPDIQAQALREAADVVKKHTGRLESADGADEVVSLIESVIRHRAARLTDTSEGEEK